jgi:YVTN family beta-propeller protein
MFELSSTENGKTQYSLIVSVMVLLLFSCLLMTPFQLFGQQFDSNQISNQGYFEYENSAHKITSLVPSNWNITEEGNDTIRFLSPIETESDADREGLSIEILRSGNIPVREYASSRIIDLRQNLPRFSLIHSDANFTVSNYPAYKIIYSYINGTTNYDAMRIWAVIGRSTYTISYTTESNRYPVYLPLIETMIGSLRVEPPENADDRSSFLNTGGIELRDRPYNIAIDTSRNRVYVTDFRAGTVSVIDGRDDSILTDIKVGLSPSAIDINPDSGRLFVANSDSDSVSVIDGSTNTVMTNISVGDEPLDVVIDPHEKASTSLIFVANSDSDTVSVIEGSTNTVIDTINLRNSPNEREEPIDLAVNTITNRLYVANNYTSSVSVLDYHYLSQNQGLRNETVASIQVGDRPASIDFNPTTNRVYVANSDSDTVSVINGSRNEVIANVSVGTSPYNVEVNADENLIYVANYLSNTVSVIDGSTNRVVDNISVNRFPFVISYNPVTKIAYVTHLTQNIVSMINNADPLIGVRFEINPADSGYIRCNENEFSNGDYFRYGINTTLTCSAVTNSGFSFSSWSGAFTPRPIPSTQTTFGVSKFGNVTANFVVPVEFTLPQEYLNQLTFDLLIGVIPATIVGWSIPAIAGWMNGRRQRRHLKRLLKRIDDNDIIRTQDSVKYSTQLEEIRKDIQNALSTGKIDESQFNILKDKISGK